MPAGGPGPWRPPTVGPRLQSPGGALGGRPGSRSLQVCGRGCRVNPKQRWGASALAKGAPLPVSLQTRASSPLEQTLRWDMQLSPLPASTGHDPDVVPGQPRRAHVQRFRRRPSPLLTPTGARNAHSGESRAHFTFFIQTFYRRACMGHNRRETRASFFRTGSLL